MTTPNMTQGPNGTDLAYVRTSGGGPGVMFLGGFMSDMTGSKALTVEAHAKARDRAALRFDYSGHGQSGGAFADGTIGAWAADAIYMLENYTDGPVVLVGSSMGGWIASLLARQCPEKVAGFIGIAAAPDFTDRMWTHDLNDDMRKMILTEGRVLVPSDYGPEPYTFTKALFDDGRAQSVLTEPLKIDAPVRLIQGTEDPDVPWETAKTLACHMEDSGSPDVEAILVPGGDHRLSSDSDLARLTRILDELWGL